MVETKSKIMNLPNILSMVRMGMVPLFVASILYLPNEFWCAIVGAALFGLASLTDMLDGMIARKYHLITDFGKFLDPLADKFMVFAALVTILASPIYSGIHNAFVWVAILIMLRELGVTSLRLVVASKSVVVAASWFGKAKTCTQIAGVLLILLEPVMGNFGTTHILSYVMMVLMVLTTLGSGFDYVRTYWPYITGKNCD